jgi:hypothetical protein
MKRIILISLCIVSLVSCRKRNDDASTVHDTSYPTITFTGQRYVSIPIGGTVPTISASAYDSVLNETCSVEQSESVIDVNTPGLYLQEFASRNSLGFRSTAVAYIAVTNVSPDIHLEGEYMRLENDAPVTVTRMANGLYQTNDVGGAPTLMVTAYFVHINDSTIDVPYQPTSAGTLGCTDAKLYLTPDTMYEYKVDNGSFGTSLRHFQKQ